MKKTLIVLSILLLNAVSTLAQVNDTLYGIVGNEIIKINQNDAGISNYQTVSTLSGGDQLIRFSWCELNSCFYAVYAPSGSTGQQVAIINNSGQHTLLGPVTVPGETVYFLDAIVFSEYDSSLYVSASLDGGPPSDYWTESIIKVDTSNLVGTVVGTVSHSGVPYQPEADILEFGNDGYIYYADGEGGSSPYCKIYKQDNQFLSPPTLMYQAEDLWVSDLTYKDGELFFSLNRDLRKLDAITFTHTNVGTMFSSSDFGGNTCRGLDWKPLQYCDVDASVYVSGNTIVSNQDGALYQWIYCDELGPISGEINQSLNIPSGNGSYAVIVDLEGCIDTSQCITFQGVGVSEESQLSLMIYPNPAQNIVNISIKDGTYNFQIFDISGKVVQSDQFQGSQKQISMETLESGTYFLRIYNDDVDLTERLVVEN